MEYLGGVQISDGGSSLRRQAGLDGAAGSI